MSEPPARLPKIVGILKPYEEDEEVEFYLKFCSDVLLEVLQFGDRRRLTELERVGRRFHHLVEKWFGEMPFLRLYMHLKPGFSELEALVGSDREEISLANLAKFPPFLRFNEVLLNYHHGSLLTKCRLFEECLDSIKPALKDSNKTCFAAKINQADPNDFSDHSTVVIYLRDILLPLCDSSRSYEFNISFELDENSTTKIISSILQISQVGSCSNVSINLFNYYFSTRLPVDDISNWLAPKTVEGAEICGKKGENRFLIIHSNTIQTIPNMKEMWEHLMEKFDEAKCSAIPYTLRIEDVNRNNIEIEEQKLLNRKTNEVLSISHNIKYDGCMGTEIKRTMKQKSQPKP